VRAAIARLPNKQRATLVLRVYHDLPHDQIARILGSSVGAVKANFFHALGNLKKLLQGQS
jgi:RNA polymerase sigma-70 factor (ECF subfamily)